MKRSNNEIENEQLYISNQDTLTSLMAIQQQILNVDIFFKKNYSIFTVCWNWR